MKKLYQIPVIGMVIVIGMMSPVSATPTEESHRTADKNVKKHTRRLKQRSDRVSEGIMNNVMTKQTIYHRWLEYELQISQLRNSVPKNRKDKEQRDRKIHQLQQQQDFLMKMGRTLPH